MNYFLTHAVNVDKRQSQPYCICQRDVIPNPKCIYESPTATVSVHVASSKEARQTYVEMMLGVLGRVHAI